MLGHGHQLDVREAHFDHVIEKLVRQFEVGQGAVVFLRDAFPTARVDLVDAHRFLLPVLGPARGHPFGVAPAVAGQVPDHRTGLQAVLVVKRERVALELDAAVRPEHLELVVRPLSHAGQENFPDAAAEQFAHGVHPAVPMVEVAHDADAPCVRRPDGEGAAAHAFRLADVRAQPVVEAVVVAFGEEVQIQFAQDRPEGIRIGGDGFVPRPVGDAQAVSRTFRRVGQHGLEKSGVVGLVGDGEDALGLPGVNHRDFPGVRREDADDPVVLNPVRAEERERVAVGGRE